MKFCEECGAKLEDTAQFCEECGTKVEVVLNANSVISENTPIEIHKRNNNGNNKKIIIVISAVIIVCIIAVIVIVSISSGKYVNKDIETITEEVTTEENAIGEMTTEEVTTEEVTTEEITTEETTTVMNNDYQKLLESVNGDYMRFEDYIGTWHDEYSGRCFMDMISAEGMVSIKIRWNNSYNSMTVWEMSGYYDKNTGSVAYVSGSQVIETYLDTAEVYKEIIYNTGRGVFYFKDGAMRWFDKCENMGGNCFL